MPHGGCPPCCRELISTDDLYLTDASKLCHHTTTARNVLDFTIFLLWATCREGKQEGGRKKAVKEGVKEGQMQGGFCNSKTFFCYMTYCFKKKIEYISICTFSLAPYQNYWVVGKRVGKNVTDIYVYVLVPYLYIQQLTLLYPKQPHMPLFPVLCDAWDWIQGLIHYIYSKELCQLSSILSNIRWPRAEGWGTWSWKTTWLPGSLQL